MVGKDKFISVIGLVLLIIMIGCIVFGKSSSKPVKTFDVYHDYEPPTRSDIVDDGIIIKPFINCTAELIIIPDNNCADCAVDKIYDQILKMKFK